MNTKVTLSILHGLNRRRFFIVLLTLVTAALIADTSITKTSSFFSKELLSTWSFVVFAIIFCIYAISQVFIFSYIRSKSNQTKVRQTLRLEILHKSVMTAQYALVAIMVTIIVQMALYSFYASSLLLTSAILSYLISAIMLGLLAQRFISWYRIDRRNHVVMLYGLASIAIVINLFLTLSFAFALSKGMNELVAPHVGTTLVDLQSDPLRSSLNAAYITSSVVSFLLTWIPTAILLYHYYSKRIGAAPYWILVSLPLVYFVIQFFALFVPLFDQIIALDPVFNSLILVLLFTFSKPVGGVLFGIAFFIAGKIVNNETVRDYMFISAYGLILLFVSNQLVTILPYPPYPPFGLATISFMGLSSYMVLIGIYYSAVSMSVDIKLRQSVRKLAEGELRFLGSIGSAEMDQRITNEVMRITEANRSTIMKETGVESALDMNDIQQYLEQVMKELKEAKKGKAE